MLAPLIGLCLLVSSSFPLTAAPVLQVTPAEPAPLTVRPAPLVPMATPPASAEPHAHEEAPVAETIVRLGSEESQVMATLTELAGLGGARLTGSEGLERANEWARNRFEQLGLPARLEPWGELAYGFERGPSHVHLLGAEAPRALSFMTRAWSAGTDGVVQGPLRLAPLTAEELDEQAASYAGAWVLIPRSADDPRVEGEADEAREARQEFLRGRSARLRELGAAGLVARSRAGELLKMGGDRRMMMDGADELPTEVTITLIESEFDELMGALIAGEERLIEAQIDNRFVPGPVPQFNVIAELRGSEFPEQTVIVGGHIDAWDLATGVNDNGTGVSTTLEAARLLVESGARPRRTIRFELWGGEEQGLLGSRAWAEAQDEEQLSNISAVLVHDGGTNALVGLTVTEAMADQVREAVAPLLAWAEQKDDGYGFSIRTVPGVSASGSSDHSSYLRQGVPGFFWNQNGEHDYYYTHHTQHDNLEFALADDLRHSSVVVALTALGIANLEAPLSRRGLIKPTRRFGLFPGPDGVTVGGVTDDSVAQRVGLAQGDVLVSLDGVAIGSGDGTSLGALRDRGEGRKLLRWKRGEEEHEAIVEWDPGDGDRDPERIELLAEDGARLVADWYMGRTDRPGSRGAVVLLPMNRGQRGDWDALREPFEELGLATLALDPRGFGESLADDGGFARRLDARDPSVYAEMTRDVQAAVVFLEARGYARERIGLLGASVGCSVALRAAADDPRLAAVAALTPGSNDLGMDSLADIARWDSRPLLFVTSQEESLGSQQLHAALRGRDPWAPVQLVMVPGTEIHGTRMLGSVPDIEENLARWFARQLGR